LIRTDAEWLNKQNDKQYPLNLEKYREEQKQIKATVKQIETLSKLPKQMNVAGLPQDSNKYVGDKDKQTRYEQWLKNLSTDVYLDEAVKVENDMVMQKNLVYKQ
jgi:carboxyl-terminal processing protease